MPAAARGRQLGKSLKVWRDALDRELRKSVDPKKANSPKRLEGVATACVDAALGGDMQAIAEIGNRMDGKAMQPVDIGGEGMGVLAQAIMAARDRASAR